MADANGNSQDRWERLEASLVRLMTDHETFVREQEREWERQQERWRHREKEDEKAQARSAAIDAQIAALGDRIDKLVSAIGELARRR